MTNPNDIEKNEIQEETAKLVFTPEFIIYHVDIKKQFGLSHIATLIYGFIRYYLKTDKSKFYFTNDQIGEIVDINPYRVRDCIKELVDKDLIRVTYQVKGGGGKVRFVNYVYGRMGEKAHSESAIRPIQTGPKHPDKYNKINVNKKKDINTVPATPVVVNKIVDKKGITSIGALLANRKIPTPDVDNRIYTPWQDHALRIAEKLNVKVDPAWFKLFKDLYAKGKVSRLDTAYSRTVDAGARDSRKYFFWAVAN